MSFSDWAYRTAYYYGYRAARLLWRFTKPRHLGAIVMVWHDKRVLLVRTSYLDGWVAPGGGMKAHEAPVQAAIREASEEIGATVYACTAPFFDRTLGIADKA